MNLASAKWKFSPFYFVMCIYYIYFIILIISKCAYILYSLGITMRENKLSTANRQLIKTDGAKHKGIKSPALKRTARPPTVCDGMLTVLGSGRKGLE